MNHTLILWLQSPFWREDPEDGVNFSQFALRESLPFSDVDSTRGSRQRERPLAPISAFILMVVYNCRQEHQQFESRRTVSVIIHDAKDFCDQKYTRTPAKYVQPLNFPPSLAASCITEYSAPVMILNRSPKMR